MFRSAFLSALVALAASRAGATELVVVLEGLGTAGGEVQIDLFGEAQAASFPWTDRGVLLELRAPASAVRAAGATLSLGQVAPGRYALFAMHDENGNGDLDLNLLG